MMFPAGFSSENDVRGVTHRDLQELGAPLRSPAAVFRATWGLASPSYSTAALVGDGDRMAALRPFTPGLQVTSALYAQAL